VSDVDRAKDRLELGTDARMSPLHTTLATDADRMGGAGALILMLVVGFAAGLAYQRFNRSRRDLKGARAFVKTASRTHWRGSVPRLLIVVVLAASAAAGAMRSCAGNPSPPAPGTNTGAP
jgi:hypothetical protein